MRRASGSSGKTWNRSKCDPARLYLPMLPDGSTYPLQGYYAALNRRLLVQALAEAAGHSAQAPEPAASPPTDRTELFAKVLDELRDVVVARSADSAVVSAAKSAAKVLKYLQAYDRFGLAIEASELAALADSSHDTAPHRAGARRLRRAPRVGGPPRERGV